MTAARPQVVIGVGNEFRRDDGVGLALVDLLAADPPSGVSLVRSDGDPATLIEAWDGAPLAIVVDAVRVADPEPGRIHRTSVDSLPGDTSASTHVLGLVDAARLAEALGRTPVELVVFAVEVEDVSYGSGLTPEAAGALPVLVEEILHELQRHR